MKRYHVFAGIDYEPRGGWSDLVGSFDSFEDADEKARNPAGKPVPESESWSHVADGKTGEVVSEYHFGKHGYLTKDTNI